MSNLIDYAIFELHKAKLLDPESDYNGGLGVAALDMVTLFSEQGHSGGSAAALLHILDKLLRFHPLTPLTGEDDEWVKIDEVLYQNKRYSSVFKSDTGSYDATSGKYEMITFPYMPGVQK